MAHVLKFKKAIGTFEEVEFDPTHPVTLEVESATTASTVKVKDPTPQTDTVEFIGGREKRG